MHVRMVTATIQPGKLDEAIELWKSSVAPTTRLQKGFISARVLADRSANRVRSMGFWESEADFRASIGWNDAQLAKFTSLFAAPAVVENFELAAEVSKG